MRRSRARWTLAGFLALVVGEVAWATASPSSSNAAGASRLDLPEAPSQCRVRHFRIVGRLEGGTFYYLSWRDNSADEDGFTVERWWRNESGEWVLDQSMSMPADSAAIGLPSNPGPDIKYRVKATSASGDSSWSNWAH